MDPISAAELLKLLDTVLSAAKKAENEDPSERDRAVDGLNTLAKTTVSTAVLAETQAGKRVRSLSKHPDASVASAATKVVATWKNLVRRESMGDGGGGGGGGGSQNTAAGTTTTDAAAGALSPVPSIFPQKEETEETIATTGTDSQQAAATGTETIKPEIVVVAKTSAVAAVAELDLTLIPATGDGVRDKVRSNLASALHKAIVEGAEMNNGSGGSVISLAVSIEIALLEAHGGLTPQYKAKFRQLHFNLKDDKNPDLRKRVVEGSIPPSVLITLAPEELASDAKRDENDRIREKKLFDAAPSSFKQATTDQFKCSKCKQRKCTYYQMQTRSADEPMTTFVRCSNCGNAWKFC